MLRLALAAFATLLVTVAPFKVAPVFSALTRHLDRDRQRRIALGETGRERVGERLDRPGRRA